MEKSLAIQQIAQQFGFDACGFAKAEPLYQDAHRLENWLNQGYHGQMHYMANHFDLRVDPTRLVPGAKSVITLLKNYYPSQQQTPLAPKVSKYAYGADYHTVIRKKLNGFLHTLEERYGAIEGRGFVDSAPVLERAWAVKSGLGWVGKNGNLLNRTRGSFFFIATLITDLKIPTITPPTFDYCGTCNRCVSACPTQAILPNKVIDGSRCISYLTIELKEDLIPASFKPQMKNWMFGCDICQDVCPWNRFAQPHQEPDFAPNSELLEFTASDWQALNEEAFNRIAKNSPIKRAKYKGIMRNIRFITTK